MKLSEKNVLTADERRRALTWTWKIDLGRMDGIRAWNYGLLEQKKNWIIGYIRDKIIPEVAPFSS